MIELRPGVFSSLFSKVQVEADMRTRLALEPLALAVEKQARTNASNGRHSYGTSTPARPGEGPAVISGTLKKSLGHTSIVQDSAGWMTKVGPRVGFTPPYGKNPTEAHRYGYLLETGLRNGAKYPWLKPAAEFTTRTAAIVIFTEKYGANWRTVF